MITLDEIEDRTRAIREKNAEITGTIRVCLAAGCHSCGAEDLKTSLEAACQEREDTAGIRVKPVGCMGLCSEGPLVHLDPQDVYVGRPEPAAAPDLVEAAVSGRTPDEAITPDHPFFREQQRIVLENSGRIDPETIEDYLAADGYRALHQVISEMEPEDVLREITASGLRGRGGGGYPTGLKWETVAKAAGSPKYVICNADEGDPGAFMDRSVLESDPHRVLEGMAIAGAAVGAEKGYIYIRAEYPLAIQRLEKAIRQAKRNHLLGSAIYESYLNFSIELRIGAGAFVCGEETALINSIEGGRGMPRPRPPYPAESGLFGQPTLINNVETFANVPTIIRRGGDWFASIGTETSKGTKVFALAGYVNNTGLVEVPMGTPIRKLVFEIGGGAPEGRHVKAIQTGGPSGGCIPEEHFDAPVDYEHLRSLGSIMGSGGLIVMDETASMVDVAKFFMDFSRGESCGACIPCRVGTVQMHNLLDKISRREANRADLDLLERLCAMVRDTSLCGLGIAAPNPVLSTLEYFRAEYEEKLRDGPGAGSAPTGGDPA